MPMVPGAGSSAGGPTNPDGTRLLCPEGNQRVVCCDVIDLGMVDDTWGGRPRMKHKCQIRWMSEHLAPNGAPFLLGMRYTFSLHERSALRRLLNMWRGKPMTDEEARVFDLERLITVNGYANVAHVTRKSGERFADIQAMMPLPRELAKLTVPTSYVRERDRVAGGQAPAAKRDDDPPF